MRPTSYNSRIPSASSVVRRFTVSLGCLALAAVMATAQDAPSPESQSKRITERISGLQREAERLAGQARTLVGDLRKLEIDRDLKNEQAKQAAAQTAEAERVLRDTTDRLSQLELRRLAELPDMRRQLVDVYKRGRTGYARLLLGAGDLREFGRAARAVSALASLNQRRIADHRRTLEGLRKERATFAQRARDLQTRESIARRARAEADRAIEARTAKMAEIDSRRDLTAQYVGELQVAYDRVQQQIKAGAEGPSPDTVAVPLLPFQGELDWPTAGRIGSRYGQTVGRLGGSAIKNGIEIAADGDTPVRAVHAGSVAFADAFTGFGTLVIVDHGGNNYSLYGYLGALNVKMGDKVETGAEIGTVGASPAGPPALYFELRIDGKPTDPVQWLKPR